MHSTATYVEQRVRTLENLHVGSFGLADRSIEFGTRGQFSCEILVDLRELLAGLPNFVLVPMLVFLFQENLPLEIVAFRAQIFDT